MPKISVIVPVYNVQSYVERCINSILSQSFSDFEMIMVDDGSTDSSGTICDRYAIKDERITVIHQSNRGLSGARNTGLKNAKGEYICFVDSDDAVAFDYLSDMYSTLRRSHADIVECGRVDVFDNSMPEADHRIVSHYDLFDRREAMEKLIRNSDFHQTVWDKMFKREILGDILFPEGKLHEDEFFTWRVLINANLVAVIDRKLYYYYHRDNSIMTSISLRRLDYFQARKERHIYIDKYFPEFSFISRDSIAFPCILMMQKYLNTFRVPLIKKAYPIIQSYYKAVSFRSDELKAFPFRRRIWYLLANRSLLMSAGLRILLHRNS